MVSHLLAIALPLAVVFVAVRDFSFFSWHPICMIVAYGFLMTEAMMIFSPDSSLIASSKRPTKVTYHGYILFCALLTALGGFAVIYSNKRAGNRPHFTSWHGFLGVIAVGYTVVQVSVGIALKYGNLFVKYFPKGFTLAKWKLLHGLSGCTLYVLACVAIGLGLYSGYFVGKVHEYVWGACTIAVIFLALIGMNHMGQMLKGKAVK